MERTYLIYNVVLNIDTVQNIVFFGSVFFIARALHVSILYQLCV